MQSLKMGVSTNYCSAVLCCCMSPLPLRKFFSLLSCFKEMARVVRCGVPEFGQNEESVSAGIRSLDTPHAKHLKIKGRLQNCWLALLPQLLGYLNPLQWFTCFVWPNVSPKGRGEYHQSRARNGQKGQWTLCSREREGRIVGATGTDDDGTCLRLPFRKLCTGWGEMGLHEMKHR